MYIIYEKKTTFLFGGTLNFKHYETRGAAKAARTKAAKAGKIVKSHYRIMDYAKFKATVEKQVEKTNMMSGKKFTQSINTPLCCDPSSETYWSM
jgi:hypothetical protein